MTDDRCIGARKFRMSQRKRVRKTRPEKGAARTGGDVRVRVTDAAFGASLRDARGGSYPFRAGIVWAGVGAGLPTGPSRTSASRPRSSSVSRTSQESA